MDSAGPPERNKAARRGRRGSLAKRRLRRPETGEGHGETMAILGLSPYTWVMIAFLMLLVLVLILGDIGGIGFAHDIHPGGGPGLGPLRLPILPPFGGRFGGFAPIFDTGCVRALGTPRPAPGFRGPRC